MLNVIDLNKALDIIQEKIIDKAEKRKRMINIENSCGEILSEPIKSPINVPNFDKSIYDGYAVKAEDTFGTSESDPIELKKVGEIRAGQSTGKINSGECMEIATGAPLPKGSNAVIMVEKTERNGENIIIKEGLHPDQNTIKAGKDISKGETILKKGKRLSYKDTGLISSLGINEVHIYEKPQIGVISTGDEIISPDQELKPGLAYDINGRAITDALKNMGASSSFLGISKDDSKSLKNKIKTVLDKDLVIISGGASVGEKDYTVKVLESLGEIYIHGVAVKPGKPLIVGRINDTPVFGLPGNPTSSLVQLHKTVKPLIEKLTGIEFPESETSGTLSERVKCPKGRKFLLPVYKEKNKVIPSFKGSYAISSFARAEGYVEIPKNVDYLEEGKKVKVRHFNP